MKKLDRAAFTQQLADLIANPATTARERVILQEAQAELTKTAIDDKVLLQLKQSLQPLAIKRELTPAVGAMFNDIAQIQIGISRAGMGLTWLLF